MHLFDAVPDPPVEETASMNAISRRVPVCLPADLPEGFEVMSFLGVDYCHVRTVDGGDLYLTRYGVRLWKQLLPENWYEREWFEANRERLEGTSRVYRLPTRQVEGMALDLVVKFSRVGEVVPVDTLTVNQFVNAEFNSPFEEFSLLMELRAGRTGPRGIHILTQRPMAIYVPSKRLQLWQTGRSEDKINAKIAQHPGVEIDILRQYVVLFSWVKGLDAVETADYLRLRGRQRARFLSQANHLVIHELEQKGYQVVDMKPQHIILRPQPDGSLLRDRNRQFVYSLIDYELLQRTQEHEQMVRNATRRFYLRHMAHRFNHGRSKPMPAHLKAVQVMGVDYVTGHAQSTGGLLWVVGKDPDLFNFFLPERWRRTPKQRLSEVNQVCYTQTKDNVNLVWRVSRMGDPALPVDSEKRRRAVMEHGYNSPFEEFSLAMELTRSGLKTVYPRAIYQTGSQRDATRVLVDERRMLVMADLKTPEGGVVLSSDRDYITVWGFWNGPDELLAMDEKRRYWGVDVASAQAKGLLDAGQVQALMRMVADRMALAGIEDLDPKPDHLLISFDANCRLVLDDEGLPEVRLCSFELLRRIG